MEPVADDDVSFGTAGQSVIPSELSPPVLASLTVLPDGEIEALGGREVVRIFGRTVTGDYDGDGKADVPL